MSHGPFGKRVERLPVAQGGTAASTAADARRELDVPSLTLDNTFKGANEFQGGLSVTGGSIDATTTNADFADVSGGYATFNVVEANGLRVAYVAKTADYALDLATDCVVDVTANSPTITLPTAVGVPGAIAIIKNSGAGTVTLATTSSQTIDGAAPGTIAAGNSLSLVSTNANWIIV